MPYPDQPNVDLVERIPLGASSVLDVGCGSAALAVAYRRLNPRARIFGIDNDPATADLAASRCDAFSDADTEAEPRPFGDDRRFDCIIYGDVLEHMREPWTVLAQQVEALEPDGTVLICVPNLEHWSFALHLLQGDWDYKPHGLLDRTHLRWFTNATMRRGLMAIGLQPCDVRPRVFDRDKATSFVELMSPVLRQIGVDPAEYATRATPLQYIWRAIRTPRPRMVVSATMLRPIGGVSDVRVLHPQAAIGTDPTVTVRVANQSDFGAPPPGVPAIAVLHRPIIAGDGGLASLRALIDDGWVVVTEFDDHPDFFPAMQGGDQHTFTGVHAIQTSTEALAYVLRARNPEVAVFANAIRALPEPANFIRPDRLTLFFGALNRTPDWEPLIGALNAVAEMAGDRLAFSVVHDETLFEALATPHKRFTPTCDHATYMRLLGESEISLMPLADTPFNRAKSDLKFIEAGACRVAALASPVVYGDTIEDGRTGLLFRDAEQLRSALLRLIAMPETARTLADSARTYVRDHRMLAYQVRARIAWYRDLWERRSALTAALHVRVPALGPMPARTDDMSPPMMAG